MKQHLTSTVICILAATGLRAQSPASGNTLPSSGLASIASTTNSSFKLSVNGAVKLYGTGLNSVTSPTLYLQNTIAPGKIFAINASDAAALQIVDITALNAVRFIVTNTGNTGVGTAAPISPLQVNGTLTVGNTTTNGGVVGALQLTNGGASPISNRLTFGTDGSGWKFAIAKNQSGTVTDIITVQDNNYIGINTTTPAYHLDVTGTGRYTSTVTAASFIRNGGSATQFLKADGSVDQNSYLTANQQISITGDVSGSGTTSIPLVLASVNNNVGSFTNPTITVDAKGRITKVASGTGGGLSGSGTDNYLSKFSSPGSLTGSGLYDNGNAIGIGTTNPMGKLHVKVSDYADLIAEGGDNYVAFFGGTQSAPSAFYWTAGSPLRFGTTTSLPHGGFTEMMRIGSDGNVGIGTVSPQSKLAVNGVITSKKLVVTQTGWPDFVFAPGYPLPKLNDIENFIRTHRHLPGVPSAEDITNHGLDLGDNQALLMQKIEELTLLLIDQNKKLQEQNVKIEEQGRRLMAFECSQAAGK